MILTAVSVILPVFFVIGLGFFAGRIREFDGDQVKGLNELVLDYAMPAMMFAGTVSTTRSELLAEGRFVLALLGAFVGLFLGALLFSVRVLHHSIGAAALHANLISMPSVAFIGPPIFRGLFGASSILSIATAAVLGMVTLVPLTVVLVELHASRSGSGGSSNLGQLVAQSLWRTFRKPMVLLPLLGAILVLADIRVPPLIDHMLLLIGSATSGTSLFLAGLIIASYRITLNREIVGNTLLKMIGQPLLMVLLVTVLGVKNPLASEGILICAIPSAVFAPLLAPRYKVYEIEAASTMVLTAFSMIVTFPLAVILTGA